MWQKYLTFLRGVATNWLGVTGISLVTASFLLFLFLEMLRWMQIITNAYLGLITYLLFPALFMLGLILIPAGWYRYRSVRRLSTRELLTERFPAKDISTAGLVTNVAWVIAGLTLLNLFFIGCSTVRMLHFMDEPHFCGTACHSVMNPEWVSFQQSPHAHVRCVDCHVGEGTGALIDAKLNGLWQMISVTFNLYERPIPTPVHNLRPARETCEKCHWPEKFYGKRLHNIIHYGQDETSTPLFTSLALKVDAGGRGAVAGGIHWHISHENEVRYTSVDDEREEMIWVEVRRPDGNYQRFVNRALSLEQTGSSASKAVRSMDCVDCHNRATHIYENPSFAIDDRIRQNMIDTDLPYIKREGLRAITHNYPNKEAGLSGIATHLQGFYRRNYPGLTGPMMPQLDDAIGALQGIYHRNIHPVMNITWGSYPNHLGHAADGGCFRCHTKDLVDEEGISIRDDCTLCHSILADDTATPFQYLLPLDEEEKAPDYETHKYHQEEFMGSFQ